MLISGRELIMKKGLTILLIIALLIGLFYLGLQKRFYNTISQETLVGTIRCAKSPNKNYDFYLFYFPIIKGKPSDFKLIGLKGNNWAFEGEIIKWKRPLNIIGLKTIHRPIKIYDSYGTSYILETRPKKIIFKVEKVLPCVDTSFISVVKQAVMPKIRFGIYATNSGYLIRKIR